jgi:ABC-type glycerol-3-phosphate transport system permease component
LKNSLSNNHQQLFSRKLIGNIGKQVVLISLAILSLYPLYFVIVNSLKSKTGYNINKIGLPMSIDLDGYRTVFLNQYFPKWIFNTIILTIFTVVLTILFSSLAAYALSKMEFKGRKVILNSIISLMVIPVIVLIIPMFIMLSKLHLNNNYIGVIFIYIGILLPFNTYLLYSYFLSVYKSLIDSAKIDGCSNFQIYLKIMLPLSKSSLITLLVYDLLWTWNELLIALIFMQKEELRTLMVGLNLLKGRYTVNVPTIMAGLVVGIVPILLVYLYAQKYFVKGLVAGSIKE